MDTKKEPKNYYHISSVAKMYNLHPQTLRLYEREGLLSPSRSEGNTRLYTEGDLRQLELILNLIRELGVNLAGVEVILNMRKKIEQMEEEVNRFLEEITKEFFQGREDEIEKRRRDLVRIMPAKIIRIEKEKE
ncbi:MAG: MerR family transcriptional regulator [Candidatus Aminicenantaceae bacterium]